MKLKEWNARLHGLVIFRTLLEDPVLAKLLDLTDRMEAGGRGMGPVCDAVAQFEAALFERTTDWSQYPRYHGRRSPSTASHTYP